MKIIAFFLVTILSCALVKSQETVYKNPVIPGFYPDPSICRNGDDYYLVTSTFQYFPGVPVFHSNDLVNWKQIGHCLTRKTQLPLDNSRSSGGIYAPTIRYHNGIYYMVTTNVTGGGNFYVTTADPFKEWSEPVWVKQGGIDPTIFFDDNEEVYFTSTGNNEIVLSKIDIKTGKLLSEIKSIWAGTGGRYPEAPHIYKLNGWYYLLIAEGGTEYGHMVTIARSKDIWGPYESNPENPILTHRTRFGQYNPIQGTGHGDIIQAHDNSWWMVFLGFRPVGGNFHHLGRETFLTPLRWNKDGWPYVNELDTTGIQVKTATLPIKKQEPEPARDNFDQPQLKPYWNFIRNPRENNYSLNEKPGFLSLKGSEASLNDVANPTFVGRRQQHLTFQASAGLLFEGAVNGDEAGITVMMDENHHYDLFITSNSNQYELVLRYRVGSIIHTQKTVSLSKPEVILSVKGTPTIYNFSFQEKGSNNEISMGDAETRYLSSEVAGGFTGVYIGMYSTGNGKICPAPALFDWFEYSGIN
jgi:alpha-N-arabinofuranosidase